MSRTFEINSPAVVSEIIDGEAVIMNLDSGTYYSTHGVGSLLWHGIGQGRTYPQLVELVKTAFPTVNEDFAAAIDPFIDQLVTHELVRETPAANPAALSDEAEPPQMNRTDEFQAPVLNVYPDMQDLLVLDPIHDVDDVGWPTAKPADRAHVLRPRADDTPTPDR